MGAGVGAGVGVSSEVAPSAVSTQGRRGGRRSLLALLAASPELCSALGKRPTLIVGVDGNILLALVAQPDLVCGHCDHVHSNSCKCRQYLGFKICQYLCCMS